MKPSFDLTPAKTSFQTPAKGLGISDALKRQQDASSNVGVIRSPSIPTDAQIGPQSLQWQQITIPAGQKYPVQLKGDFIYIEGFTWFQSGIVWINNGLLAGLAMRTDTLQTPIIVSESYRDYRFPTPYNFIEFENRSTLYPITVQFWSGFGEIRRDRNDQPNQIWTYGLYVGAPLVISKNHFLAAGPQLFYGSTSRYVQKAFIRSASIVKSINSTIPTGVTLWLFSAPVPNVTVNQTFDYSIYTLIGPGFNTMGAISFSTWQTGDAVSGSFASFRDNLNIPVYSNQSVELNPAQFTLWGYLVADANYNSPGNDIYDVTLQISYA